MLEVPSRKIPTKIWPGPWCVQAVFIGSVSTSPGAASVSSVPGRPLRKQLTAWRNRPRKPLQEVPYRSAPTGVSECGVQTLRGRAAPAVGGASKVPKVRRGPVPKRHWPERVQGLFPRRVPAVGTGLVVSTDDDVHTWLSREASRYCYYQSHMPGVLGRNILSRGQCCFVLAVSQWQAPESRRILRVCAKHKLQGWILCRRQPIAHV